jgi:hypothetical protein
MTWFLVYLFNLRVPLLIVAMLGILLCALIGYWGSQTRGRYASGTADYDAAVWRQMTCLKVGAGIALLSAFVWGIPAPDYNVRYVPKPVRVEVIKVRNVFKGERVIYNSYQDLYNTCVARMGDVIDQTEAQLCHKQAIEASRPAPKLIRQTKYIKVHDPYLKLFTECNSNSVEGSQNPVQMRNERLKICHQMALDGSRD